MSGPKGAPPSHPPHLPHLSLQALLDHWLGDSDAAATDAADEHLMRCDACGAALDELIALGDGVRAALRAGGLLVVTSGAFADGLARRGLRVREYSLPHNGSVNCTVAPGDEVLVSRLQAPLAGVQRLDIRMLDSMTPEQPREQHDVPFDAQRGEVVYLNPIDALRRLPAHSLEVTLLAVEPEGRRELGRYTFRHAPWPAGGAA